MRMEVDLPAPLGPTKPKTSPRRHVQVQAVDGHQGAEAPHEPASLDDDFVRISAGTVALGTVVMGTVLLGTVVSRGCRLRALRS